MASQSGKEKSGFSPDFVLSLYLLTIIAGFLLVQLANNAQRTSGRNSLAGNCTDTAKWKDDRTPDSSFHSEITIKHINGNLFISESYPDGSENERLLTDSPDPRGLKLEDRPGNELEEYYVLTPNCELQYWSGSRIYYTAVRL